MQSDNSNHIMWVHYCIGPGVHLHILNPFWYWSVQVLFGGGFTLLEILSDAGAFWGFQNKGISLFTGDPFVKLIQNNKARRLPRTEGSSFLLLLPEGFLALSSQFYNHFPTTSPNKNFYSALFEQGYTGQRSEANQVIFKTSLLWGTLSWGFSVYVSHLK